MQLVILTKQTPNYNKNKMQVAAKLKKNKSYQNLILKNKKKKRIY